MRTSSLLGHLLELYHLILTEADSPRFLIDQFYRRRRYLGSRDRAWLSARIWPLVRNRLRWQALAEIAAAETGRPLPAHAALRDLALALQTPHTLPSCEPPLTLDMLHEVVEKTNLTSPDLEWAETLVAWSAARSAELITRLPDPAGLTEPACRLAFGWPCWLTRSLAETGRSLLAELPTAQWMHLQTRAFMQEPPVGLRVNTLKTTRLRARHCLAEEGLQTQESDLSPEALRAPHRRNLHQVPAWTEGWIEVQDEGSQMVAAAVGARPGWRVLDPCTGAGGKALHLAALMSNDGQIYATDAHPHRAREFPGRIARAGAEAVQWCSPAQAAQCRDLDAVLIDAPCSGTGMLRRRPELCWQLKPEAATRYNRLQQQLLAQYGRLLRPGGILVYATCSFLPEENDRLVERFLETSSRFEPEDPRQTWRQWHGGTLPASLAMGRTARGFQLLPGLHGCDGFYIARLRRTS